MSIQRRTGALVVAATAGLLVSLAPAVGARAASSTCALPFPLRARDFSHALRIDNRFFPLRPGTVRVYDGTTVDDAGKRVPHQVVTTVTDLYKRVDGVRSRVILDVDIISGEVAESELAFFAQDDRGAVWNLGEYPQEIDNGRVTGAPSTWISGQRGATGGIHMLPGPARPTVRGQEYLQGRAPAIDFLDCAEVAGVGGTTRVPAGRFTGVLTTHEVSPLESRTAVQTKEHAPGIGIVRIGALHDPEGEQLALTRFGTITDRQLDRVDDQVRAMDRRAFRTQPVYRATGPLHGG